MPRDGDQTSLYRLVLDQRDFGIHNMSITKDVNGQPLVTSLCDWETGRIRPAILSGPLMAVTVDLVTGEIAAPSITRLSDDDAAPDNHAQYMAWARRYFKVRTSFKHRLSRCMNREVISFSTQVHFDEAPNYERAIQTGKVARHFWFNF
jgi:hypothetical protein